MFSDKNVNSSLMVNCYSQEMLCNVDRCYRRNKFSCVFVLHEDKLVFSHRFTQSGSDKTFFKTPYILDHSTFCSSPKVLDTFPIQFVNSKKEICSIYSKKLKKCKTITKPLFYMSVEQKFIQRYKSRLHPLSSHYCAVNGGACSVVCGVQ